MASILEFRRSAIQVRTLTVERANGSADIVLFPGVRYERAEDDTAAKSRRKRARRRDHLDLDD